MRGLPRLEVLYHSIHYLDTIRLIAGEPQGVYCRAVGHPALPDYSDPRSSIILDYGNRAALFADAQPHARLRREAPHVDAQGRGHRSARRCCRWASTSTTRPGCPTRSKSRSDGEWQPIPLRGSWFTEAFEGPMSNLQRFVAGEDAALVSPVDDALRTMAVVEACYVSSAARRHADSRERMIVDAISTSGATTRATYALDRRAHGRAEARLPARRSRAAAGAGRRRSHDRRAGPADRRGDRVAAASSPPPIRSSPAWSAGSICRPTTSRRRVARVARTPKLVGVRHIVQSEPDDRFLLRSGVRPGHRGARRQLGWPTTS